MDMRGTSQDKESIKVGDIEKEKEIERRLRELGLWENKRLLESRVASMLEDHIDEKDVLSRTLRNCRRRRGGEGDGKTTAVEEIRKIISPRIIRDCYGQKLAYHVNILMGCFTRNIEHEVVNDIVIIRGSTAAVYDPKRLTKELRLELPPSLNMAALQVSYAAGAVKIRVPYLLELPPLQKRSSESSDDRSTYRFASISPIYSMKMQLNGSTNRTKLGSSGAESLSSDSPHSMASCLSPPVPATSDSAGESIDLQSRSSSILESPTVSLPSPYSVFEDDTHRATGSASDDGKDLGRCTTQPAMENLGEKAPRIFKEIRYNGVAAASGSGSGFTPSVFESDNETALSEEFCHRSEEPLPGADAFNMSNGIGHYTSVEQSKTISEENHHSSAIQNDSNKDSTTSKRTSVMSNETVDSKIIDSRLGNNYLGGNRTSTNMAAIYVNIADSMDRNADEDFEDEPLILNGLRHPTEVTSLNERNAKNAYPVDQSNIASLGSKGENRCQDKGVILTRDVFNETSSTSTQRGQEWKAETWDTETSDNKDIPVTSTNIYKRQPATSVQRTFNPSEELEENLTNGGTETTKNFESDSNITQNNGHYLSAAELYDKSRIQRKCISKPTCSPNKAASENAYEDEEHSGSESAVVPRVIPMQGKGLSKKNKFSFMPRDDSGVGLSTQDKSCDERLLREKATEKCDKLDMVGENEEQVSHFTSNEHDRGKVTLQDTSDESRVNLRKDNNSSLKQNRQREEEEDEAGLRKVTEDSNSDAISNRRKMSPRPKKPNKVLNSLLDSLDETML